MRRVHFNRGDEIIELTIRDTTGARIEVRRSNLSDAKENGRMLKWLIQKWGAKFELDKNLLDVDSEFFKF